jgi:pimeloyl-ACP methyl ester carboxylesterase
MAIDSSSGKTLKLKDGRILGYAEFGELTGMPILGFHGTPGSRLVMKVLEKAALDTRTRIIAPDRPGYGISRPNKHGTLLGYVNDIVELVDALKIDRFAVLGVSGGGPYPLACAYKIPHRISVAVLISGIGPLYPPNGTRDMVRMNKIMFLLGRLSPSLAGLLLPRLIRASLPSMQQHIQQGTSPSADISPEIFAIMANDQQEAIRDGGQGVIFDMKVLWRAWGFPLQDIQTKTLLWHGAADNLAPAMLAHYIADHLPDCEATFYPNEGHTEPLTKHISEIMTRVVIASQST